MRGDLVVDALVAAMLDGDADPEQVVARCTACVEDLPEIVVETVRDVATSARFADASFDALRGMLVQAFADRWQAESSAEEPHPDIAWWTDSFPTRSDATDDDDAHEPAPSLVAYLDPSRIGVHVVRYHLPELRPDRDHPNRPASLGDLASRLGLDPVALESLSSPMRSTDGPRSHYHFRWVPKRRNGMRLLEIPKRRLRVAQRRMLDQLLGSLSLHDAAHGFVIGRSPHSHAALHAGSETVLAFDLEDFFGSIGVARIAGILRAEGFSDSVARAIARLATVATPSSVLDAHPLAHDARLRLRHRHLPQGAPTSPTLANLAARGLDARLSGLAAKSGYRYSRYADDLAFSGPASLARRATSFGAIVAAIVLDEGFRLRHDKTRCLGRHDRQRITGLVVNTMPAVARDERERLEAILVNCLRHGASSQNREAHPDFRAHLLGRVAHVAAARTSHGEALYALFDRIAW